MCRGMIAQEPSQVSFLSIVKSMRGCWSKGDDDQYRIRGGSQVPLLRLQARLDAAISLSSAVTAVKQREDGGVIVSSEKLIVHARAGLLTGSPAVISRINIQPPLNHNQVQLLQVRAQC